MTKWIPSVCLLSSLSQTAEVYNNFAYFFAYLFLLCSCIGIKIQGTCVFSLDTALKHCLSFAWNLSDYKVPIFYLKTSLRHSMTRTRLIVSESISKTMPNFWPKMLLFETQKECFLVQPPNVQKTNSLQTNCIPYSREF